MKKGPAPVARQSGGMRSVGLSGEIDSERLEQQAVQGAVANKAQQQQSSLAPSKPSAQSGGKSPQQQKQPQIQQPAPREVGTLKQELINRPLKDAVQEIKTFFDINRILGINKESDSPEEIARKKKLHQRWQNLTAAEQKVAQEKFERELKKKQEEEQQQQLKKQKQEEEQQQSIAPPSSVSKKPGLFVAGKSGKKKAQNRLQQQMKTMGTMGSPN